MRLFSLHGFLGSPSDWEILSANLGLRHKLHTPDLFEGGVASSMDEWAMKFNRTLVESHDEPRGNLLIGYSLGGRLALHVLLNNPSLWKGGVIVSAQTGLTCEDEKASRLKADMHWASRLETEEWHQWINDWNAQPIFKHDPPMERPAQSKERLQNLSLALQNWSLGRQYDLSRQVAALNLPILWIVGAKDEKYLQESRRMSLRHPLSSIIAIEKAGHRAPWSHTKSFIEHIEKFINDLEEIK